VRGPGAGVLGGSNPNIAPSASQGPVLNICMFFVLGATEAGVKILCLRWFFIAADAGTVKTDRTCMVPGWAGTSSSAGIETDQESHLMHDHRISALLQRPY